MAEADAASPARPLSAATQMTATRAVARPARRRRRNPAARERGDPNGAANLELIERARSVHSPISARPATSRRRSKLRALAVPAAAAIAAVLVLVVGGPGGETAHPSAAIGVASVAGPDSGAGVAPTPTPAPAPTSAPVATHAPAQRPLRPGPRLPPGGSGTAGGG